MLFIATSFHQATSDKTFGCKVFTMIGYAASENPFIHSKKIFLFKSPFVLLYRHQNARFMILFLYIVPYEIIRKLALLAGGWPCLLYSVFWSKKWFPSLTGFPWNTLYNNKQCVLTGTNVTNAFAPLRKIQPHGPLVNSELYPGWLTHWGESKSVAHSVYVVKTTRELLAINASLNYYVFFGGTNFGFTSGKCWYSTYVGFVKSLWVMVCWRKSDYKN